MFCLKACKVRYLKHKNKKPILCRPNTNIGGLNRIHRPWVKERSGGCQESFYCILEMMLSVSFKVLKIPRQAWCPQNNNTGGKRGGESSRCGRRISKPRAPGHTPPGKRMLPACSVLPRRRAHIQKAGQVPASPQPLPPARGLGAESRLLTRQPGSASAGEGRRKPGAQPSCPRNAGFQAPGPSKGPPGERGAWGRPLGRRGPFCTPQMVLAHCMCELRGPA